MKIFEKSNLCLKEDVEVKPNKSNANFGDINSDLRNTQQKNPTASTFHIDANNYNGNSSDNEEDVVVKDDGNVGTQISQIVQKPGFNTLASKGQLGITVQKESKIFTKHQIQEMKLLSMRENSIPFTKSELQNIL